MRNPTATSVFDDTNRVVSSGDARCNAVLCVPREPRDGEGALRIHGCGAGDDATRHEPRKSFAPFVMENESINGVREAATVRLQQG
jgi:hypothetical protein